MFQYHLSFSWGKTILFFWISGALLFKIYVPPPSPPKNYKNIQNLKVWELICWCMNMRIRVGLAVNPGSSTETVFNCWFLAQFWTCQWFTMHSVKMVTTRPSPHHWLMLRRKLHVNVFEKVYTSVLTYCSCVWSVHVQPVSLWPFDFVGRTSPGAIRLWWGYR